MKSVKRRLKSQNYKLAHVRIFSFILLLTIGILFI